MATIKDGKIIKDIDYTDDLGLMIQLGVVPNLNGAQNLAVVQGMYNSFANGDVSGVLESFTADIEWNEAENFPYADGNPYIGPDAVLKGVFTRIGSEWEFWKLNDIQLNVMANNKILATGKYQAKNKKTKKEINAQFAHKWTLENGKAKKFQQYADTKQVANAIK